MGIFFTNGEQKKRPGIYQRYVDAGTPSIAGASNGVAAVTIRSNWGPIGKTTTLTSFDEAFTVYGSGGKNGTVSLIKELFNGGAKLVYAVRLGAEESKKEVLLKDAEETPADAVKMIAKCSGSRKLQYMIRESMDDSSKKEVVVYENGVLLEKISFLADGEQEGNHLIAAGRNSQYFLFQKAADAPAKTIALLPEAEFPAGEDSAVTNADYTTAFQLLEPFDFQVLAVDSTEPSVHQLAAAFVRRVYEYGKLCFAVIGEKTSVPFAERCAHARAYNDYRVIYVGSGFTDISGEVIEGEKAAARIAGMTAAVSSDRSLTHTVLSGAADLLEMLTSPEYEQAIDSGMITFSKSSSGSVWVESGITTLVTPTGEEDEGWKKIKRVKVRFELMNRISATTEPLIGQINNNADGRATVMQAVQGVLNTMVSEEKLLSGAAVVLDESNPPSGDSAWFHIEADDVDALEKMYFVYKFRFTAE